MEIEQKSFYSITEVSQILNLPNHVLRFWEEKFTNISPHKSKGRRYYREGDIKLLKDIKHLLYEKGYTIKGVQRYFQESSIVSSVKESGNSSQIELLLKRLYRLKEKLES